MNAHKIDGIFLRSSVFSLQNGDRESLQIFAGFLAGWSRSLDELLALFLCCCVALDKLLDS